MRETATKKVVTVIEVLSPTNKRPGKGRDSRSDRRPRADLYVFNLPDVIPLFPLPLPYNDGNVKEQSFVGLWK